MADAPLALVTGASQGIGTAIARTLSEAGHRVVLTARGQAALEALRDELVAGGGSALVLPADLTREADVARLAERTVAEAGVPDVVVACGGVAGPTKPLWEISLDEWEATMAVNVTGTFLLCRALLPAMIARGSGSVVVVGSATGKRPMAARTPYAASKTALIGLVRSLAWDAGRHGVRVNLVSPGPVAGPRLDGVVERQAAARGVDAATARADLAGGSALARVSTGEEIAAAVLYLSSDGARAVTGEDLNVSGGWVMHG